MSEGYATNEKGHFLNEKQKEVKQKIMENLMEGLFNPLQNSKELFDDPQLILDLLFSILVMFNRDILTHIFQTFSIEKDGSKIMRNLFEAIREEVVRKLNESNN